MTKNLKVFFLGILILFCFSGCASKSVPTCQNCEESFKTIKDQAGREVAIPKDIKKIYCTSTLGSMFIYSLCPEKLAACNDKLSEKSLKYLGKDVSKLPIVGSLQGKKSGNIEEISKLNPDIIISMGDINDSIKSQVDKFQKQCNIPFIVVDGKMENLPKSYKFIGELLNKNADAQKLASYCEKTLKETQDNIKQLSEDKKLKIYYAEGPKGLETDPEDSLHSEVIKYAGGKNVANFPVKHGTRSTVSIEQIISWNPNVIVSDTNIFKDQSWQQISAVKENKIYLIPNLPFNWFDRPPSINRLMGIRWLQSSLYPDLYKSNITEDTKEFFKLFYHKDLSNEEANKLLKPI